VSLSQYIPGTTLVHRASPGVKIVSLVVVSTLLFVVPRLELVCFAFGIVVVLYWSARIPWHIALAQIKPLGWILALLFIVQFALDGWHAGLLVVVRLACLFLLASLLMLTTRSSDMIEALQGGLVWLRAIGVNPAKVSLAISLALRFIPVLAAVTSEVREAQRARGLDANILAIAVPVVVRTLKMADDIAAAIEARSYDPDFADGETR
jgi:biotin transport system permease protein